MKPLIVPGKLDSLATIRAYVLDAAAAVGLDKKAAYRLQLAVDEVATNIVTYGYEQASLEGEISVSADMDEQALTITLEDTAAPFDPLQHTSLVDLNLPPEQRKIGGLGIYLATSGVDEFSYAHANSRNRNLFVMYRPGGHS